MENMVEHGKDCKQHYLNDTWVLWAHLPHDTNWSVSSYINVFSFKTVEDTLSLFQRMPNILITNCMLFLMRKNVQPLWEDPNNINGGCFSYKISNKNIAVCWKNLSYVLLGETLTSPELSKYINGITISPKKNFCIIKIWLSTCQYQNPDIINDIEYLSKHGCLFKRHIAETN